MIGSVMTGIVEHFALNKAAVWIPYCGAAPEPADLLARWNGDPVLVAALAVACAVGLRGGGTNAEKRWFLTAMAVLAILFVSPLCALTSALFSARTIHHLALIAVAAPLFAAAFVPKRVAGGLPLWTGIHAAVVWLWHLPAAYEAALSQDAVYWLMQASLLLSGVALWRGIRHAPLPEGLAALLATTVSMGLLGALLTFSGTPLYAPHALGPLAWGFTPLEDQQLAGLIMWVAGAGLYLAAALLLATRRLALWRVVAPA